MLTFFTGLIRLEKENSCLNRFCTVVHNSTEFQRDSLACKLTMPSLGTDFGCFNVSKDMFVNIKFGMGIKNVLVQSG